MKELSLTMVRLADKVMPNILKKTLQGKMVKAKSGLEFHHSISSSGFDTLRIGFPKVKKSYQSNHINMQAMCDAIGAILHQVKYTNPHNEDSILYTREPKIHRFYYKTYGNKLDIGERFEYTNGVWLIEYKNVIHWLIDSQKGKHITLELYGLSQLDHELGQIRYELLNLILGFYEANTRLENKLVIKGYDFHVDLNKSYDYALDNLIIPYIWTINKTRKKNQKIKLYPVQGKEKQRSCYLQSFSSNIDRKIECYDKSAKNTLAFDLSRFEITVRVKNGTVLNRYEDLKEIELVELKRMGIL